ncbi:MAG: DegT/DnrJ/EryC1/StrS family aminotransferase, partial [Blastocatellia bacterium]
MPMKAIQTNEDAISARSAPRKLQFPFLDLKAQFDTIRKEVLSAVVEVLESQHFILGPEVEALERDLALLTGVQYAVGCASGSDALLLALLATEIERGEEVITTPFTFVATAAAIARVGARPVFVDIDPHTFNLDPAQIEWAITARTRAILPVHLFGLPSDMDPILDVAARHQLVVIEDAAQAIGSRYHGKAVGNIGAFGCFSFFPSKNLGGAGDGGLITTNDPMYADRLKVLRVHGSRRKYDCEILGMNSRLDALQAAILRVKVRHLDAWTSARQRNAERYRSLFRESGLQDHVKLPEIPPDRTHVYNQFVVRADRREELRQFLSVRGIPTEIYYPSPVHLQRAFGYLGKKKGDFPHSEVASEQVLALPIFSEIREEQQQ